jgi:hypothetical protein
MDSRGSAMKSMMDSEIWQVILLDHENADLIASPTASNDNRSDTTTSDLLRTTANSSAAYHWCLWPRP